MSMQFKRFCQFTMVIAFAFISGACVSSEEGDWISLAKTGGEGIFEEKCGMCHRGIGMGVGILGRRNSPEMSLLENRPDLQTEFIEAVVRNGFGVMLPMSRGEVSDAQLLEISAYLSEDNGDE